MSIRFVSLYNRVETTLKATRKKTIEINNKSEMNRIEFVSVIRLPLVIIDCS